MQEEFEAKHDMIQKLLDMLKSSAVGEVENGLHPAPAPEGMPKDAKGLEIEKVAVVPGEMGDETSASPDEAPLADAVMHKAETSAEGMDESAHEGHDEMGEMPAFATLMKKKGKK